MALDPESEARIIGSLRSMWGNKAVMFITQRLAHTVLADRIVILDKGRIVEQGSRAHLLGLHGRYAALVSLQSRATDGPAPVENMRTRWSN